MKLKRLTALALFMVSVHAFANQPFTTPEQAADALTQAIEQQNETALNQLLGEDWRQFLPPEGVEPEAVARFLRDWKTGHRIVQQGNTAHLVVGDNGWQLPIPLVKAAEGWRFDMQAAEDEILTRAIGRNELAAIEALHAYVDAQQRYYAMHQRYAEKIVSTSGKKDGLYWPVKPGESPSPLGPAFSPKEPGVGYHGYHFRILPDNRNGFAMIAWPVSYGESGIMSFMINGDDDVWQADLGPDTAEKAQAVSVFKPDGQWQLVAP